MDTKESAQEIKADFICKNLAAKLELPIFDCAQSLCGYSIVHQSFCPWALKVADARRLREYRTVSKQFDCPARGTFSNDYMIFPHN